MKNGILSALVFLASTSGYAQSLVNEYQDAPLSESSNECATYRVSRKYDVRLSRYLETSALSHVLFLDNGDILLNRRVEDHLPYKKTPQLATVIYRYHADGSKTLYPFSSKSMQQQGLFFGALSVSHNNAFAVSIADRAAANSEFRVVLLTDLNSKVTTEVFSQSRDDENLAKLASVSNEGQVTLVFESGKRMLIAGTKKKDMLPFLELLENTVVSRNERDFTGVKTSPVFFKVEEMTYQAEFQKLSFMELGQEVGSIELKGCTLKSVDELSPRSARVTCEEGIMWLDLDIATPVSDLNRNLIGFLPCK